MLFQWILYIGLSLAIEFLDFQDAVASSTYQEELLEELMLATPGSVIEIPAGHFEFDTQLSLVTDQVVIRGQGMEKTILSFKGNKVELKGFWLQQMECALRTLPSKIPKVMALK